MKAPCLDCEWHLGGNVKSCDKCLNCKARIAYVRGISGREHDIAVMDINKVKEPVQAYRPEQKEVKVETTVQDQKTCTQCSKTFPATKQFFNGHAYTEDRLMRICKVCQGGRVRKGHALGKETKTVGKSASRPVKAKFPSFDKPTPENGEHCITIDFSNHCEQLECLRKAAKFQLRTVENQALFYLIDHMSRVDGANA